MDERWSIDEERRGAGGVIRMTADAMDADG